MRVDDPPDGGRYRLRDFGVEPASLFAALSTRDVTVVSSIVASQPLVVFVLARVLLLHLESLSAGTALAGIGIVVGTIAISL